MELWIRSQDKECLIKTNIVEMEYFGKNCFVSINTRFDGKNASLGTYKTKERALEVLDEIQNKIENTIYIPSDINDVSKQVYTPPFMIYEMPEE